MKDPRRTSLTTKIVIFAILYFVSGTISAQEILKHPRVVELEDSLKASASEYVKARFPTIPFMVSVSVDPLRREQTARNNFDSQDSRPYFDPDEDEEIRDEWDNPQVPLNGLVNRVKRISVKIAVPSKLREEDVNELKDGIFAILHLTPARDEIQINRRDWVMNEVPWLAIYVGGAALLALLVGLLVINRSSANRIARALTEIKLGESTSSGSSGPPPMMSMDTKDKSFDNERGNELMFNDPIKMKELATRHIEHLIASPLFPNHRDIFLLERFGKRNPAKLGAILAEFPSNMQTKMFAYSAGFHWVEALNKPGMLDFECLELIQAMTQIHRAGDDLAWDYAVLAVWRLDEDRTQFLKSLPKDEAFALLMDMPRAVAVSEARKAFPGSWAAVLDLNYKAARIEPKRIKELEDGATRIQPLNKIEMVQRYKTERELLDYLKTVDPTEERDIYGALPESSLVHKLRPPFYPIFEQAPDTLLWLVPNISVDQWALALFNLPKLERAKVDTHLSEKQKFLLVERFKQFDQINPDRASINSARERVGASLRKILNDSKVADNVNDDFEKIAMEAHEIKAA